MTSRLLNEIRAVRGETYLFYGAEGKLDIRPDTSEYFTWLAALSSFHFKGQHGHFTARLERKKPGETYWYAYRKAKKHQFKRYLGRTDTLAIHRLEAVAAAIQEEVNQRDAPEKKPRKKPLPKAMLHQRIRELEKTVSEQEKRILELEEALREVQVTKARERYRRVIREHKES